MNIVFTESRKGSTFIGDLWKRFVVAEICDLRSNFGKTTQVAFTGRKTQHCNYGDIPVVEKFEDSSGTDADPYCKSVYRRILGFQAGRAKLVMEENLVDREKGVFLRRPLHTMTKLLTHPSTRSLFFRHYLLPFMGDWSVGDCLLLLQSPPPSVVETTKWFASKLSGVGVDRAVSSDAFSGCGSNPDVEASRKLNDRLLIDLHATWDGSTILFRYKIATEARLHRIKEKRYHAMCDLVRQSKGIGRHLFRETVARNRKNNVEECFTRDPLGVRKYLGIFADENVFGSPQMALYLESESADVQERVPGDYADCCTEPALTDTVFEVVNMRRLEGWASSGCDRRQGELLNYIASLKTHGSAKEGYSDVYKIRQDYRRKGNVGRAYCSWISLQQRTRECRLNALIDLPWKVYELDQANCQPRLLLNYIESHCASAKSDFPLLTRLCTYPSMWRKSIAEYYMVPQSESKSLLPRVLFGGGFTLRGKLDILPCVRGLFFELKKDIAFLKEDLSFAAIMELPGVKRADNPDYSALSIFLGGMEYKCMSAMNEALRRLGYAVLSLVHDGVYFACPDDRCVIDDFAIISDEIYASHSMEICLKDIT